MKPRLATVSVVRGELALLVFGDAVADNEITKNEQRAIGAALSDWLAIARATNDAQALGDALSRGIADERYRKELIESCFAAIDELPLEAA